MLLPPNKKIYFLSDFHLGAPDPVSSLEREKIIVKFLDEIKNDAAEIFLVGDMFDFWYEYCKVVPKGYVRLLALPRPATTGLFLRLRRLCPPRARPGMAGQ